MKYISFLLIILQTIFILSCRHTDSGLQKIETKAVDTLTLRQKNALQNEIKMKLKMFECPGAVIYVMKNGNDFLTMPYGVKSTLDTQDLIDTKTIFRIGSLSKGFAGLLTAKLANAKMINLQAPVKYYLPDFAMQARPKSDTIRVWHLLSHATGLTEHAYSNLIDMEKDKETIIKYLNKAFVRDSTGKKYAYQNAAFSMIEEIIQKVTGMAYPDALHHYLLDPLHMTHTTLCFDSLSCIANKALPHRHMGRANGFIPIPLHRAYYNTPSAGGINSNLIDMKIWLMATMGMHDTILSVMDRDLAFKKNIYTSWDDKYYNTWEHADSSYYGLGWRSIRLREQNIIFHGGQVNSYRSEIAFNPKTKTGVVALFNSPCDLSNILVPLVFSIVE